MRQVKYKLTEISHLFDDVSNCGHDFEFGFRGSNVLAPL
jgi:hypothetical protein